MWIIERTKGVVYDGIAHMLRTETGEKIASVYIGKEGKLEISLMMNTDFRSDEGWGAVGFNGCENHIASHVWLKDGGGVLEYQKNRHSVFCEPGRKISVKIMMLEGDAVASFLHKKVVTKNFFFDLCVQLKDLFGAVWGWSRKTA
ncbi:MAG: hypothetical protein WC682_01785 [Parcubacteria group bacterium]|jgi:hypothetical protein